ncbi:LOW QUALITY PROTEIN: ribulose-1,5 bisphosphate carboxylase/oxygenase large subunit N-methyltransferase, chloroplastic [Pyrus x bretschneideri]|uniref:LOW QUALITY PROTEIN: ribulose-1,5 bisphosphate carboxylase/oxygenase large subunit N-methyltransferase, chloroplastic n=1 Tax=Pyrus x bretschneideri TaxID=225117 RepID=UPI002030BF59|nr:LOW QUALITY PROTEIN: ribulose-1,5 bisphosphate carboxylase/oxygenase large subunit N-methyltransferase, chloroplastic [Pyrus x bretschneideri]
MDTLFTLSSLSSTFLFPTPRTKLSLTKTPTHLRNPVRLAVTALSSPLHQCDPSLPPPVQTFWQWLRDEGVVSSKYLAAKPALVPEGMGLVAHRDISKNEVVLEVPKRLWINPETVSASEVGSVCSGLKQWVSVALFLMREKSRDDSKWRTYLDILPESTNSTVSWSEEGLDELQGTQLSSTTMSVKEYVRTEFLKLEQETILPNKQPFPSPITMDDFFWAFGILRSRAFSRLRGQNLVLIPLADFINHSSSITTEEHAYEVKGAAGLFSWDYLFSLRSPAAVKAGVQVKFSQYDINKSNAEFALDYGIIDSNTNRSGFTLTLEISEPDPFYEDKLDIAEKNGLGETAYFDIFLESSLPPALIPYLRLVALGGTDAFLLESIFRNDIWDHLQLPVSPANEELICRVVQDACKSALSGYPTTIEEDDKFIS